MTGSHQSVRQIAEIKTVRAIPARGAGGSTTHGSSGPPDLPCPFPAGNCFGRIFPPTKPINAAARMMNTNETLKWNIARNDKPASAHKLGDFRAFEPMRFTAETTMAITAGISP